MKFSIMAFPIPVPVPPEQGAESYRAAGEWIAERLEDGRMDCAYVFTDGGAVVNITGDALMVLFGAPRVCTDLDHAWSSIRAASDMQARAEDLSVHWRRRGIPHRLNLRVGINTGYGTVGIFGSDLLQVYTASGTPVNIAARFQTEADAGEILCGFSTYALVADRVLAEARAPISLHGIARPVEAYTILGLADELEAG